VTLTVRARLIVFQTVMFGLLLAGRSVLEYQVLSRHLDADATTDLEDLARGLRGYLRFEGGVPVIRVDNGDPEQAAFVHAATRYYQVFDADSGRLLVQSDGMEPLGLRFTADEVHAFGAQPRMHDFVTDYGRIRLSSSVISQPDGRVYLLQVGASLDAIDRARSRFVDSLLLACPAGLIAAALLGRVAAGVALAPLARFAIATRTIDVENLQQRLPVRGTGDELDRVAVSFNETLARLEQAIGQMREFSTALAHELRTPLAALRAEIEMSLLLPTLGDPHETLTSQLEEIDKLTRLIDRLLTVARAEAGEIELERDRLDLGALASDLAEQLRPVASSRVIDLRCETPAPVVVCGDRQWLERALLNLLDNALTFTPPGGRVTVRTSREADAVRLEVRDTGIGMAPAVAARVFEPFFRASLAYASAAEVVGLGLRLVKWIVDRHGGRVDVTSSPGHGAVFTIRLPAAKEERSPSREHLLNQS
jgi:heavy metal sensor kinase